MVMYIYCIEFADGSKYVGKTDNPKRRFKQHRNGKGCPATACKNFIGAEFFIEDKCNKSESEYKEQFWMEHHGGVKNLVNRVNAMSYTTKEGHEKRKMFECLESMRGSNLHKSFVANNAKMGMLHINGKRFSYEWLMINIPMFIIVEKESFFCLNSAHCPFNRNKLTEEDTLLVDTEASLVDLTPTSDNQYVRDKKGNLTCMTCGGRFWREYTQNFLRETKRLRETMEWQDIQDIFDDKFFYFIDTLAQIPTEYYSFLN